MASLISTVTLILINSLFTASAQRATSIFASPQHPLVEEGGILSLHCKVSNLIAGEHEVSILRITDAGTQRLSIGNNVMQNVDERVFLAVRQMESGPSLVYFLTIIHATIHDKGEYFCKVIKDGAKTVEIDVSSTVLDVQYFPGESEPECYPTEPPVITEGQAIILKCSSATANPPVRIQWLTDGDLLLSGNQTTIGDKQVSYLSIVPSKQNAVYLCRVTSSAFPNLERTCHIGPMQILRDPNYIPSSSSGGTQHLPDNPQSVPIARPTPPGRKPHYPITKRPPRVTVHDCEDDCSRLSSSRAFYWIVTTVTTSFLAFVFCIVCFVLLCKYHQQSQTPYRTYERGQCISTRQHNVQDIIYSELDLKRGDNYKEYMVLSGTQKTLPVVAGPETNTIHQKQTA